MFFCEEMELKYCDKLFPREWDTQMTSLTNCLVINWDKATNVCPLTAASCTFFIACSHIAPPCCIICYIMLRFSTLLCLILPSSLPLQELLPVRSVALSSRAAGCVFPFSPCPNPAEEAWLWLWAGVGLWIRFPSLPALISLSPMRSMHERLPCSSFLKLGLLDPADPGRPRRGEDLDIFPVGLSRALVRYSRVSLRPSFSNLSM